ncbi:MAG: hypothetical protein Q7T75_00270, partial [Mesorhizobium sp.]|nr:hypothetical protein [Mesorhizobium sp.]
FLSHVIPPVCYFCSIGVVQGKNMAIVMCCKRLYDYRVLSRVNGYCALRAIYTAVQHWRAGTGGAVPIRRDLR